MHKLKQQELTDVCGGSSSPSATLISPGLRFFAWLFSSEEDATCTYTDEEGNSCPCDE